MMVFHGFRRLTADCMRGGRGSGMTARVVAHLEAHGGSRHLLERASIDMSPACI